MGDFNSDLTRKAPFDSVINSLIEEENLICADHLFTQLISHTYTLGKDYTRIDHVLLNTNIAADIIQVNILDEQTNTSDHRAISFSLNLNLNINKKKILSEQLNKTLSKVNWEDEKHCTEYSNQLNQELNRLDLEKVINAKKENVVENLDIFINEINRRNAIRITAQNNKRV